MHEYYLEKNEMVYNDEQVERSKKNKNNEYEKFVKYNKSIRKMG